MASKRARVAILPSAGMGHLSPFIRLASLLFSRGIDVTFIITLPTVTKAESDRISTFLSANPTVRALPFHPLPLHTDKPSNPFSLQTESIRRSSSILRSLLADAGPLSAIVTDIALASCMVEVAASLSTPSYIFFPSSAIMLAFVASFPAMAATAITTPEFQIPGIGSFPGYCIETILRDPNNLFTGQFIENGRSLVNAAGIIVNTFCAIEDATVGKINDGQVVAELPKVFPLGPFIDHHESIVDHELLQWLNRQPVGSVIYVSFGSRNTLSKDRIVQLAMGLQRSGCRFLWVVKTKEVDREEEYEKEMEELLPEKFFERVSGKGLVVKKWVQQERVLAHPAVGGFINHCGWNSVIEAMWHGVPVFAWPLTADQMFNATVVEKSGCGVWVRSWRGGEALVTGEEIGERLKEWIADRELKERAKAIEEKARAAVASGGQSYTALMDLINEWDEVDSHHQRDQ